MSTMDVFASIAHFDKFDLAQGVIDWVAEAVQKTDLPIEVRPKTLLTEAHFCDPKQDMLDDLQRAKELVREAELLTQQVLADL